jgi:hypothetical protein
MRLVDNELENMYKQSIPGLMWNKQSHNTPTEAQGEEEV